MGREAGFSATQFCKKAQTAPVEMTELGREWEKGNDNDQSRSPSGMTNKKQERKLLRSK
jgi:hypothetical protein